MTPLKFYTSFKMKEDSEISSTLPFVGLAVFLVFVYFEPSMWFPFIATYRVAFIVAILTLILTVLYKGYVPKAFQNKLFVMLLIIAAISTLTSKYSEKSGENLSLLFKEIVLYFLIIMVVNSRDYLKKLFYIVLTYAAINSIFTLILANFGQYQPGYKNPYRMVSYFGGIGDGPNQFGSLLLAVLPLPVTLIEGEKSWPKKILLGIILLSFLLCITRTRSRGTFIGLIVVLMFILWEYRRKGWIIALILLFVVFTFFHTHSGYWERINTLKAEEIIKEEGRFKQIQYAIELIRFYPLTGVGIGNFIQAKSDLLGMNPEEKLTYHVAHNAYLEVGAEIGILGMMVFILLIVISIIDSYSTEKYLKDREGLCFFYEISKGIRLGFIGFAVSIFFLSEQYNSILYQWIALIVALKTLANSQKSLERQKVRK